MIRGDEDITEGLLNAFRLEKGAQLFYQAASERMQEPGSVKMFKKLADVEGKHMREIYDLYNGFMGDRGPVPFEEFRDKMEVHFTESGRSIEAALSDVTGRFFVDAKEVLRFALEEEEAARKHYLQMAEGAKDPSTSALYRDLADDEDKHIGMIRAVLKTLS